MAITGRSARECFENFRDHVSKLVSDTIGLTVPIRCTHVHGSTKATLAFWEMEPGSGKHVPATVKLETAYGPLFFHLAQDLEADLRGREYVLRTKRYWYRLQATGGYNDPGLIRWEFNKRPADDYCRHHLHIAGRMNFGNGLLDLACHTPTGYVFIEFILRFLIVDLGVKAKEGWREALQKSEEKTFREFVPGSASGGSKKA